MLRNETVYPGLMSPNPVEPKSTDLPNRTENAFKKVKADDPKEKKFLKNVVGILNRISPENYSHQMNQLRGEITSAHFNKVDNWLRDFVNAIFTAALNQPSFSPLYAKICSELFPKDSRESFWPFRRILLQQCERWFDGGLAHVPVDVSAISDIGERSKLEETEQRFKRQTLANVRFVGELFKLEFVSEKTIRGEIGRVLFKLNHTSNPISLEAIIVLLDTIGDRIEKATEQAHTDHVFAELQRLVSVHPDMRIRSLLADLVGRRASGWDQRNEKVANSIPVERPVEVKKSFAAVPTSHVRQVLKSVVPTKRSVFAALAEMIVKANERYLFADLVTADTKVSMRTRLPLLVTEEDTKDAPNRGGVCEACTSTFNNATAPATTTADQIHPIYCLLTMVCSMLLAMMKVIHATSANPVPRTEVTAANFTIQPPPVEQTNTGSQRHRLNPRAAPFYAVSATHTGRSRVINFSHADEMVAKIKETGIPWVLHRGNDHDLLYVIIGLTIKDNGFLLVTHPDHPDFVFVFTKQPGNSEPQVNPWVLFRLGEVAVEVPSNATIHTLRADGSQHQEGEYLIEFVSKQREKEFFSSSMAEIMKPKDNLVRYALWVVLTRNFRRRPDQDQWRNLKVLYDDDNVLSNKICKVICKTSKRDPGFQPNPPTLPPKRRHLRTFVDLCNKFFAQYGLFVVRVLEPKRNARQ